MDEAALLQCAHVNIGHLTDGAPESMGPRSPDRAIAEDWPPALRRAFEVPWSASRAAIR